MSGQADGVRWCAWLADGTMCTSARGAWVDLPRHGVLIVVWWDTNGIRHLECGADGLLYTGIAMVSVNIPSPAFERAAQVEAEAGRLKYGQYLAPDAWAQIRQLADDQREFPGG